MGRSVSGFRARVWRAAVLRSGMLTAITLALLLGGLILFLKERGKGRLHKLEMELQSKQAAVPAAPQYQPGGQDAIVLQRTPMAVDTMPEFLSATLLPGRGMNVLQIMARIPSLGDVPLLVAPSLEEVSGRMTGTGLDIRGVASLENGSAFEVPWANHMGGLATPDNEAMLAVWRGTTLNLPTLKYDGAAMATGGLLLKRRADSVTTDALADGWQTRSVYNAGSFDGHWISQTEVTTQVTLNGRVMEFTVNAKNTGTTAEPIGIGWRGHFRVPSGDRANAQLRLPNGLKMERRDKDAARGAGLPTGKVQPLQGDDLDYTRPGGQRLGRTTVDASLVQLKQGIVDIGPMVELRDLTGKVGLKITLLTPTIKALRVTSTAENPEIMVDPQFNYDDPFGREWQPDDDTGMVVLQPGQATQWKIRLEIFALNRFGT